MCGSEVSKLRINRILVAVFCSNRIIVFSRSCMSNKLISNRCWMRMEQQYLQQVLNQIKFVQHHADGCIFDLCVLQITLLQLEHAPDYAENLICITCVKVAANVPSEHANCSICSMSWDSLKMVLPRGIITACFIRLDL